MGKSYKNAHIREVVPVLWVEAKCPKWMKKLLYRQDIYCDVENGFQVAVDTVSVAIVLWMMARGCRTNWVVRHDMPVPFYKNEV